MIYHLKIGCYDFHLLLQLVLLFFHEIQHMQKVGSNIVILLEKEKVKVKVGSKTILDNFVWLSSTNILAVETERGI